MAFIPKKRRANRKRAPRKSGAVKQSFAKRVQAIVNKNTENKAAFLSAFGSFNSGMATFPGDILQLIPNITNGTTDFSRIGDQIRGQSLDVDGWVTMSLSYISAASSARVGVRMMIVQPKMYGSLTEIQSNAGSWLGTLLKKGGTTTGFTGVVSDMFAPINTDAITKHYDKVFYLNLPYVQTAVGEVSTVKSTKLFKIHKNLRNKLLKYDTSVNSGYTPTLYNPVLMIGYVHLDGSVPDVVNTQLYMNYSSSFTYQDA